MSLLSKLFGGKSGAAAEEKSAEPVLYGADFLIFPEPIKEKSGYRIAARIEKDFGGELKVHQMIRADTIASKDEAAEASLMKAQIFIDQMGDQIFN